MKVIREILRLLWKALRVVLRNWLAKIMKRLAWYVFVVASIAILLTLLLVRC